MTGRVYVTAAAGCAKEAELGSPFFRDNCFTDVSSPPITSVNKPACLPAKDLLRFGVGCH